MKKLLFLLAVAGMISFVACKSSENKTEATADSTAVTETPVDTATPAVADTTVAQ
jgi:hypothetical protein